MKLVKIIPTKPVPLAKVQDLDKALREKFSAFFSRPEITVYCKVGNKSSEFMVGEFDICCDDKVFEGIPTLAMGFIMAITSLSWENPLDLETMSYSSNLQ